MAAIGRPPAHHPRRRPHPSERSRRRLPSVHPPLRCLPPATFPRRARRPRPPTRACSRSRAATATRPTCSRRASIRARGRCDLCGHHRWVRGVVALAGVPARARPQRRRRVPRVLASSTPWAFFCVSAVARVRDDSRLYSRLPWSELRLREETERERVPRKMLYTKLENRRRNV